MVGGTESRKLDTGINTANGHKAQEVVESHGLSRPAERRQLQEEYANSCR